MNDNNKVENYGIKWGPFTLKIPFIHIKFLTAEFLQGMVISGATAFAGAPVVMALGLSSVSYTHLTLPTSDLV